LLISNQLIVFSLFISCLIFQICYCNDFVYFQCVSVDDKRKSKGTFYVLMEIMQDEGMYVFFQKRYQTYNNNNYNNFELHSAYIANPSRRFTMLYFGGLKRTA